MEITQKPKNPEKSTGKKTDKVFTLTKNCSTPSSSLYTKYKADKTSQFTSLFIRTYGTTEEVERLLEVVKPDEYAYIVHDRDKKDDGSLKEPHIHLLVYKRNQFRLTKFLTFTEANTRIEIPRSKKFAYEYLTHKNNPDKTSYNLSEIIEYHEKEDTFSLTEQEARDQRNVNLLDDIGVLTRREMAIKYGTDYIKNYERYERFMNVVRSEEMEKEADALASIARPEEEFFHLAEFGGDDVRLTLADFVCVHLRDLMDKNRMPTCQELIKFYYETLLQARDYRRSTARALHCYEEDVQI